MIYRSVLITGTETAFLQIVSDAELDYCALVPVAEICSQEQALIRMFMDASRPTGLCIDLRVDTIPGSLEPDGISKCITLLVFCERYLKYNGDPVICFLKNSTTPLGYAEKLKDSVCLFLKQQGYENVIDYLLTEENTGTKTRVAESYKIQAASEMNKANWIEHFRIEAENYSLEKPVLFFSVDGADEVKVFYENLVQAENDFSKHEPELSSRIYSLQTLKRERETYLVENKILSGKLLNLKDSLDLLRKDALMNVDWFRKENENISNWLKKENEDIKNWYQREYEQLPLWFKRLGHLLKRFGKQ
jgi:hypothetical protein